MAERVVVEYLGGSVELPRGETHVGRGVGCRVRFNDEGISRRHVLLVVTETGMVKLRDLGSTNGTQVNGVHIASDRWLKHGDIVEIGNMWFRLRIERGDPGTDPDEHETRPGFGREGLVAEAPPGIEVAPHTFDGDGDGDIKPCPRCSEPLDRTTLACEACGFTWPRGRATANTQRIDLNKLMADHDERRAHVRVPHTMPVVYDSESLTFEALARDVSLGGMFIECELLDARGTVCTVTVLPNGAPAIPLRATVAHVRERSEPGNPSGMGVSFSEITLPARRWLESVLMVPPSTPMFE